jgi:hypothetical protein
MLLQLLLRPPPPKLLLSITALLPLIMALLLVQQLQVRISELAIRRSSLKAVWADDQVYSLTLFTAMYH